MAERIGLGPARRGETHSVYLAEDGQLIAEWHDFGDHAPYESANLLCFDADGQAALAAALGAAGDLAQAVAERFQSWFEVKAFAEAEGVPFTKEVDFLP